MAQMFGGVSKPKPDKAMQKAQRRQSKAIDDQMAEEARQVGARNRLAHARRSGGLFARTGGAGVRDTFG